MITKLSKYLGILRTESCSHFHHRRLTTVAAIHSLFLQRLKTEQHEIALARCDDHIQKFVKCAQDQGLLVVFNCRTLNRNISECLGKWTNEEQLEKYRSLKERSLEKDRLS